MYFYVVCTTYYLYPPIEYRSFDILGKCVTMPHTFTSQEHQRSWAELAVSLASLAGLAGLASSGLNWQCMWLAWLRLGCHCAILQ